MSQQQQLLAYASAPPSPWVRIDGGVFPGQTINDVTILSPTRAVVVTDIGHAGYTTDGGATWNLVNSVGAITSNVFQVYSNNAGTQVVALGTDGLHLHISHSGDQGATWTNVTPVATANVPFQMFHSALVDLFIFFDAIAALVWTSPDGVTWTSHALPGNLGMLSNSTSSQPSFPFAENGSDLVIQGNGGVGNNFLIYHSTDGLTWTQALIVADSSESGGNIVWNGTDFFAVIVPSGVVQVYSGGTHGTAWTLESSSSSVTVAPYVQYLQTFLGEIYSGFDQSDDKSIASSTDGVAWTPITIPDITFGAGLVPDGTTRMYEFGDGIVSTVNGTAWVQELSTVVGFQTESLKVGSGLALAVGGGTGSIYKRIPA